MDDGLKFILVIIVVGAICLTALKIFNVKNIDLYITKTEKTIFELPSHLKNKKILQLGRSHCTIWIVFYNKENNLVMHEYNLLNGTLQNIITFKIKNKEE